MGRSARALAAALALLVARGAAAAHAAVEPRLGALLQTLQPGDTVSVIAIFAEQADLSPFDRAARAGRLSADERRRHRGALVRALRQAAAAASGPAERLLRAGGAPGVEPLWIVNALGVTAGREQIEALAALPDVAEVRLNGTSRVPDTAVAQTAAEEWNLPAIGAPELWGLGVTGAGVVVATLDTGADLQHADLGPRWRAGANSWFDPYGEHPLLPHDADGHGTAVIGVLVGGDAGGTAIGVAPGARWVAARIYNDAGVAEDLRVHQAFQWLLDPDGDPDTDDAPDVVNASWGIDGSDGTCDTRYQADVQALRAAGIAVVFAAGNTGPSAATGLSPAAYPEAFAAGSVDRSLRVASSSARGPSACDGSVFPEVVAPGETIRTADLTLSGAFPSATATVSGTSFAAPHVAGALALLLSALPDRPPAALEAALRWTAADVAPAGADEAAGSGLIDVAAAYRYLNVPAATPLIAVLPSGAGHNFGAVPPGSAAGAAFSIVNAGSADLLIGSLALEGPDAADFAVSADSCSGAQLPPAAACALEVAFAAPEPGRRSARLVVPSSDAATPEVRIPLVANASTAVGAWRAGAWYLDDGDGVWNAALDTVVARFGLPGDIPVAGDWDGDGVTEIGAWRAGAWYLDDGDGVWDPQLDKARRFGLAGDIPVTGDWDGDGVTEIGAWRAGAWYLDDGDGVWNAALDTVVARFGLAGDVPVTGDWDGDGVTQIGSWRAGVWYLDDGDGVWDAQLDTVRRFGLPGDVPVTGDWDADGLTEIGSRRSAAWYLDDGDGFWNPQLDAVIARFGLPGDLPAAGCWR